MKLLSRHILREIAVPAVLSLTVVSFIAVAGELRERVAELPVAFITMGDLAQLAVLALPMVVSYIIPVTYMMGILLAFGRLAQDGEITAMKAAGIPLKRAIQPVVLGGVVLTLVCFIIQDRIQPWSVAHLRTLMAEDLPRRRSIDVLPAGTVQEFNDWRVYIGGKDPEDNTWRNVEVLVPEGDDSAQTFYAKSASVVRRDGATWLELRNGHWIQPEADQLGWTTFQEFVKRVPDFAAKKVSGRNMALSLGGLLALEAELTKKDEEAASLALKKRLYGVREEVNKRVSIPLACLAVTLVSAPLGVRARRSGRSFSFAVGSGVILVYYLLFMVMQPQSLHPLNEVVLRGMIPNALFVLAGSVLLWRVDRV